MTDNGARLDELDEAEWIEDVAGLGEEGADWQETARRLLVPRLSLEYLLTSETAFGLVTASPLQRAVCRIIDGVPLGELADDPTVQKAIGDVAAIAAIGGRPAEVLILSGIRTAKSLTAGATAVRASQTCDLTGLGAGEIPRVSVISLTTDLATVVFQHIAGNLQARPTLRALLLEEPKADSIMLRHPSGRPIEIKVVAGARAGSSLVARWSAGCIFDEAPRMVGAEDGVVNYDDCRDAVLGRLLPGAQIISIGSPWAPFGPIYERVTERTGKPGPDLVVIRAPAHHMNPVTWTAQKIAELKAKSPQVYRTDILGEFADPETSLFSSSDLEAVTRTAPLELPFEHGHEYGAAMDPATRGNAWTLCVATKKLDAETKQSRHVIAFAKQWIGSKLTPLSPDRVMQEIAAICKRYRVEVVTTDQYAADALQDIANRYDLALQVETVTATRKVELYQDLATKIAEGAIELPPDPVVRSDLLSVRKRVTQNGIAIELPRTSDGRHADYAPAVALVVAVPCDDPQLPSGKPLFGTPAYWAWERSPERLAQIEEQTIRAEVDELEREKRGQWWDTPDAYDRWN